jgi:hypothetical protein
MDEAPRYRWTAPGRYDFEASASAKWAEKSAYLLRLRQSEQAAVLDAFGLAAPIAREDVAEFLKTAYPQPASLGGVVEAMDAGARRLPLGRRLGSVVFSADHAPLRLLESVAREISADLHITVWDAVLYLLADVPAAIPWVTIERRIDPLGVGFAVTVGSAAVTGGDIAAAYNVVKHEELGARPPRQIGVNDVALFLHEVHCRERGLTWNDSWERWGETAAQIGATRYSDVVAYRNKVNDLRKRFEWVRDHLNAMKRPTGRPRKTDERRRR